MTKHTAHLQFTLCLCASALSLSSLSALASTKLVIDNIASNRGNVVIALYANEMDFFQSTNPVFSKVISANDSRVEVDLQNVPNGRYAIAGFHDVNANGELDIGGPFNTPIEPLIWGNNASGTYGVPTFADARVMIGYEKYLFLTF